METDEPSSSDPKGKSKITPAMAARIKQIKPLLSGESWKILRVVRKKGVEMKWIITAGSWRIGMLVLSLPEQLHLSCAILQLAS